MVELDSYVAGNCYGIPSGMMVTLPVRFDVPGEWQVVSDVELTPDQSLQLKSVVRVHT